MKLQVYRLPWGKLPTQEPGSVGYDLYASEDVDIPPASLRIIRLGLVVAPPPHWFVAIVPRSSTFKKLGLLQANSFGVIDPVYCGPDDEIGFPAYNPHHATVSIETGEKIAQLFLLPIPDYTLEIMDRPPAGVTRGGWGSTGGYAT